MSWEWVYLARQRIDRDHDREELATLKAEVEKWKRSSEAWKDFHYVGGLPEDRGVHDTDKHPRTCGRWQITDPKESPVEAYMCGDVYDPRERCTCGADPTRKELRERAEAAEAELARLQPYVQHLADCQLSKGPFPAYTVCTCGLIPVKKPTTYDQLTALGLKEDTHGS